MLGLFQSDMSPKKIKKIARNSVFDLTYKRIQDMIVIVNQKIFGGIINMANKQDLIAKVAEATELTKKDSAAAVDAVFAAVADYLAAGEKVQLIGFGNFEVRERAARKGRNPQTGKEITIAASKVPAFKAGKALKDAVK